MLHSSTSLVSLLVGSVKRRAMWLQSAKLFPTTGRRNRCTISFLQRQLRASRHCDSTFKTVGTAHRWTLIGNRIVFTLYGDSRVKSDRVVSTEDLTLMQTIDICHAAEAKGGRMLSLVDREPTSDITLRVACSV